MKMFSDDWNIIKNPVPSSDVLKFLRIWVINIISSTIKTAIIFIPISRRGFLAAKEKIVCTRISTATIIIIYPNARKALLLMSLKMALLRLVSLKDEKLTVNIVAKANTIKKRAKKPEVKVRQKNLMSRISVPQQNQKNCLQIHFLMSSIKSSLLILLNIR